MADDNVVRPDVFAVRAEQVLREGDKGGHDGGMPPEMPERLAVLEAEMKHVKDDISTLKGDVRTIQGDITALKVDVATIKVRIDHLPTKGWAVTALLTTIGILTAVIALAPKIQKFVGAL